MRAFATLAALTMLSPAVANSTCIGSDTRLPDRRLIVSEPSI